LIGRTLLWIALAALAILYYYGLGPPPTPSELADLPWWRPRGFLVRWAMRSELGPAPAGGGAPWPVVALFALTPLLLSWAGLRLVRDPVERAAQFGAGLTLSVLALAGLVVPIGWSFFEWRFPAVVLVTASFVAGALFAPSLLQRALRQSQLGRTLWILAAVLAIYFASTEITGWEPSLQFNASPWPVVTLYGFLFFGYVIASLHIAAGAGEAAASRLGGRGGRWAGTAVAAIAAAAMSAGLISEPTVRFALAMTLAGAVYAYLASRPGGATPGLLRLAAGVLLAGSIFLSNWSGVRNHDVARNQTAPRVIAALEAYQSQHGEYPETLEQLVPEQLESLPRPRVGWIPHDDEQFSYLNFGDSYALEFPSILWIQCSYSPPYSETYEDEEDFAEDEEAVDVAAGEIDPEEMLAGSWSCDSAPPQLW
jgi:hypothetical protein